MDKPKKPQGSLGLSCDVKEKTEEYLSNPNTLDIITLPIELKRNQSSVDPCHGQELVYLHKICLLFI